MNIKKWTFLACFITIIILLMHWIAQTIRSRKANIEAPNLTILVSIDGLRYDYLRRGLTPHLSSLSKDRFLPIQTSIFMGCSEEWYLRTFKGSISKLYISQPLYSCHRIASIVSWNSWK